MKKKIMSALLLCVMAVLFCVPAFAANTSDTEASEPVVFKSTSLPGRGSDPSSEREPDGKPSGKGRHGRKRPNHCPSNVWQPSC